jgi:hypothetical protein
MACGRNRSKRFAVSLFRTLLMAALGASLLTSPAYAERERRRDEPRAQSRDRDRDEARPQPRKRDQDRIWEATREGRSLPLPMIEQRVMPRMGGADYLGPELNGGTYRLKFMQDGRVIWVDVDASTGRIIRRSRP